MAENRKKVTIYDVAQRANVTIATVSRVINGKENVAQATKSKVMQAIEELNYYPSPIASGLSRAKSQEIGILVPYFFGEFFLKLLEGITRELEEHDLILYDASTPEMKKKLIARIVGENKLDGLFIVSLPILMDEEIQLKNAKFPVVILDNCHPTYNCVRFDNVFGAYHAIEFLVENGHKDIAIITGAAEDPFHLTVASDRLKGYKMGLSMANIPINEDYILINDWSRQGAHKLAKKILSTKKRPTAIFTISDLQAVGVIDAAAELGLSIPEDLSLIGYDNMEFSDYLQITTISQPLNIAAQIGSDILHRAMLNPLSQREEVVLQPSLVNRKTVDKPYR